MDRICTCGELKNSTFILYKDDFENNEHRNGIPFHVNNKKHRNTKGKLSKSPRITYKFKTGARILKIETTKDLIDLLNYYPDENNSLAKSIYNGKAAHSTYQDKESKEHLGKLNKSYLEREDSSKIFTYMYKNQEFKNVLTKSRIDQIKKEYDGIHISDNLAKELTEKDKSEYHKGDYLIFNKAILYSPNEKNQSIRKGTVGNRQKLSEDGIKLAKVTHKRAPILKYALRKLSPKVNIRECQKTSKYMYGKKDVTKEVENIRNECMRLSNELGLSDVRISYKAERGSSRAIAYANHIEMNFSSIMEKYNVIKTINKITFNQTPLAKAKVEDVARAVFLHELGHLKNNNFVKRVKLNNNLKSSTIETKNLGKYEVKIVPKSVFKSNYKDKLLKEKLAWDFALKYDNSALTKTIGAMCLSTYQSNHNIYKKGGGLYKMGNSFYVGER